MVDALWDSLPANQELIVTGYSQGGTRAQLASMYLEKQHGVDIDTITFGAPGAGCISALYYEDSDFLDDMEPFLERPDLGHLRCKYQSNPMTPTVHISPPHEEM